MTTVIHDAAIQATKHFTGQFLPLEQVTKPNLKTEEAAFYLNRAPQTLRAWACLENGPLRPTRINGLLAWSTSAVKTLAGVPNHQKGFSTPAYLTCIIGASLLIQVILMMFPSAFDSLDFAGAAMLGAGVIGNSDSLSQLYRHPDGFKISAAAGLLTVTNDAHESVSVPIGLTGLRELGESLISLSECEFTAADCAEQAGNLLAHNVLNDFLECGTQAEKLVMLMEALQSLATLQHQDRAAAGFAVALVNVIEVGLSHLSKGGE